MKYYYKQPKYFADFKCSGGSCPVSCCDGWRVDWSEQELEHLKQGEMSDMLRIAVDNSFTKDEKENKYYVKMCDDGRCPFHNRENDLCDIQREIGEKYFGNTCRIYPRRYYRRGNVIYRSCTTSCPAVIEALINDETAAQYQTLLARNVSTIPETQQKVDSINSVKTFPYLKYKPQIFDFYVDLFNNKVRIENLIILGGLAARKISDASGNGKVDSIPGLINDYKKQLTLSATLRSVEEINANYKLKYLIVNNLIYDNFGVRKGEIDISKLHDGEQLIQDKYINGIENFEKTFTGREYALNNIVTNMFSDTFLHLSGQVMSFWDVYSYFAACISVLQVFACATGLESQNIESDFIKVASVLNRKISHNHSGVGYVLEYLHEHGITSPAHLALILK